MRACRLGRPRGLGGGPDRRHHFSRPPKPPNPFPLPQTPFPQTPVPETSPTNPYLPPPSSFLPPPPPKTPSALWDLGKSITNPSTADLLRATKLGERHVWEVLAAIESNCAVEAALDACLARLTNKARERPLAGLSARIPSW